MSTLKRFFITLMVTLFASLLLAGCMFRDLKKEIAEKKSAFAYSAGLKI